MQKIVALDIGSYSIKAVEFLNRFKSYEISNFYEQIIPIGPDIDPDVAVTEAMHAIFRDNNISADRIVTAMPGQNISSRILTFNFSESYKVEAAVYGEIEDIVPFQLDDMVLDYQILGTVAKRTFTLVVLTKNEFLASFLDKLRHIDIDPKIVDVDSLSFYNICSFLEMEDGKNYGVVDIGHEKTSLVIVQNGVLRMFRSINLGGRYISEFIARDMEITLKEAQELKHRVSKLLVDEGDREGLSKEDCAVAERITLAAKAIARELGRSLYAFKTWEKAPMHRLFISGGSSKIANFGRYLESQLDVETVPMNLMASMNIEPMLSEHAPCMAQGVAIGVRAVTSLRRHSQINLRKGQFAYVQDYTAILGTASTVAKLIAFALILLCASYAAKFYFFHKEIASVQSLYQKELASVPGMKKKRRRSSGNRGFERMHKKAMTTLEEGISAKKSSFEKFMIANGDSGALVSLQKLSEAVPKTVSVDMVEYRYTARPDGSGLVRMRIEADSFETVAKFKDALAAIDVFGEIVERSSDSKPGTDLKIAVIETNYTPK